MKKCMIAAIAAVVAGGVYADQLGDVWQWKFTGKTTTGRDASTLNIGCAECAISNNLCAVRVPTSLKIQGYTVLCQDVCGTQDFEAVDEAHEIFYQTRPSQLSLAGGITSEISNVIGRNARQYEFNGKANFTSETFGADDEFSYTYDLTLSGLGKYDRSHDRVSSVSGNFAGTMKYPLFVSRARILDATVWDVCGSNGLLCGQQFDSVAYGKWSVKYSKSQSRRNRHGTAISLPRWVQRLNAAGSAL